jgi:FtsH-binding integral membrane protein
LFNPTNSIVNSYKFYMNSQEDIIYEKNDLEMGSFSERYDKQIRLGFVRKVYGILSVQLIITSIFVTLTFIIEYKLFFYSNVGIFYGCFAISLITLITLLCCHPIAKIVPVNYILLFLFTVCECYMVSTIAAFYDTQTVVTAALMTTTVVLALTVYALTTKTDFTYLGGFLFVFTTVMLFWGIFMLIFGFFLYTLYCALGVILFGIYLIFDTQLILGRFGLEYSIDDYIVAALNIYIDIIQMFLYILQLMGRRNNFN